MLRPRVIPCLLVRDKGLVKTTKFDTTKYVGDPTNAVKIFNEKGADELIVLDIDATTKNEEPNYKMIANFATEARMPLCYGGGVKTAEQAKRIISLGVEKVAVSSEAINRPEIISEMAAAVGNQSVVVVLDVKKRLLGKYEVMTHSGTVKTGRSPKEVIQSLEPLGVGEFVINSIDNDGVMKGYDLSLIAQLRETATVPMTVLGGAGSARDIEELVEKFGVIGAAAGSLFVFKGVYRAVLINYLNAETRDAIALKSQTAP